MLNLVEVQRQEKETVKKKFKMNGNIPILIALLILCAFFSIASPRFLSLENWLNIILQISIMGIVAIGVTFIIITAGIDLSSGSVVALIGVLTGGMLLKGWPVFLVILISLLIGGLAGLFNGFSITKLGMTPFIVTLAVMAMGRGLTMAYTNGQTLFGFPESFNYIGSGIVLGIPLPVIITIILFILAHFVLSKTIFGHHVYAIGGNREAALLAGINVKRVEMMVYIFAGILNAIAALILTGRLGSALPTSATGLELNAIAAIIIGGTSLFGGKGNMAGTLIGVLIIGVLNNGLNLLNVSPFWTQFVQGFVIFTAVLIDAYNQKRRKTHA